MKGLSLLESQTENLRALMEEGEEMTERLPSEKRNTSKAVEKSKLAYKDQAGFLELVLGAMEGKKDVEWIRKSIVKQKNKYGENYWISNDGIRARIKRIREELKEESGGEFILQRIDGESNGRLSAAEKLAIVRGRLSKGSAEG